MYKAPYKHLNSYFLVWADQVKGKPNGLYFAARKHVVNSNNSWLK